ncbi:PAS domain-containing protein [Nitriliruptoraceae bacterium ZYF776]|nr:PAS domain-containing protein [Profundirhabdus halotolerans]
MPAGARRYIASVAGLAVAACVVLYLAVGLPPFGDLAGLALLTAGIAVAERTDVVFRWGDNLAGFTLVEVPVTVGLLLLPASHVVLALLAAFLLARVPWQLRTRGKAIYNLSSVVLGTAVAGLVVTAAGALPPTVGGRSVLGALGGMAIYGLLSAISMAGLLRHLGDSDTVLTGMRRVLPMTAASTLGTAAVGVVLAALWVAQTELVPLVLAPAAAVHLATRASVRADALLEATRVDRDRLGRVIDGASDGIVLLDADGHVQVWNPAMEAITGIDEAAAVGRPVAEVLHPGVRRPEDPATDTWAGGFDRDATRVAAGPTTVPETVARLTATDGTTRTVRERHARGYDETGRPTGEVVVVRDVSREQELARLRSDFVARVSHELRTPLTPIRGYATVLLERGDDLGPDERREALTHIVDRTEHLHALIEDLLLVTRFDGAEVSAEPRTAEFVRPRRTEVGRVVATAVDTLRLQHPRRAVTSQLLVPRGQTAVVADPDRTRQIVTMLLDNAVRYTPDDAPITVTVAVDDAPAGPDEPTDGATEPGADGAGERADGSGEVVVAPVAHSVVVRVADGGPGIPAAERERVFERFHRLGDQTTAQVGGIGLGLFIGRRLARAMQGDLRLLDDTPGEGATFELRLPGAPTRPAGDPGTPTTEGGEDPGHLAAGQA